MNIEFLADELRHLEHEVVVVGNVKDALAFEPDLVTLINLDLPVENLLYMRDIPKDIPIIIQTIAHPRQGIKDYFNFSSDRFARLTRRFMTWEHAWVLKEIVKLREPKALPYCFRRYTSLQKQVLRRSTRILALSSLEAEFIKQSFGRASTVIANAHDIPVRTPSPRISSSIIVIGRIEPRKNQLLVAEALSGSKFTVSFIGALNENHKGYTGRFLSVVNDSKNLKYLGSLSHSDVLQHLGNSEIYLNLAWFEVTSNADMEANVMGVNVVTTTNSWEDRIRGVRVDPRLISDNPELMPKILESLQLSQLAGLLEPRSWSIVAQEFENLVSTIISVE